MYTKEYNMFRGLYTKLIAIGLLMVTPIFASNDIDPTEHTRQLIFECYASLEDGINKRDSISDLMRCFSEQAISNIEDVMSSQEGQLESLLAARQYIKESLFPNSDEFPSENKIFRLVVFDKEEARLFLRVDGVQYRLHLLNEGTFSDELWKITI